MATSTESFPEMPLEPFSESPRPRSTSGICNWNARMSKNCNVKKLSAASSFEPSPGLPARWATLLLQRSLVPQLWCV